MEVGSIAAMILGVWGASFEALRTGPNRQSDWLVRITDASYLIEEKAKLDDPDLERARSEALRRGEIYSQSLSLGTSNAVSGKVRYAASQVASSAITQTADFRLVWLTGIGHDAEAKRHQFISTLYGSTYIYERDKPGLRPCYFFKESEFFRSRATLHGAIASSVSMSGSSATVYLCLNPLAEGWQKLRDSPLSRHFPEGLVDPIAEEACGEAYIADCNIDRRDTAALFSYLQEKYKTAPLGSMDFNMISAVAGVSVA